MLSWPNDRQLRLEVVFSGASFLDPVETKVTLTIDQRQRFAFQHLEVVSRIRTVYYDVVKRSQIAGKRDVVLSKLLLDCAQKGQRAVRRGLNLGITESQYLLPGHNEQRLNQGSSRHDGISSDVIEAPGAVPELL